LIKRSSISFRAIAPAVVVGLLAFLLTIDLRAQDTAANLTEGRRAQLAAIVAQRQQRAQQLEARLSELRAQAAALAEGGSSALQAARAATDRIASLSGTTAVHGPGLLVKLSDAAGADKDTAQSDNRIQDVDIQAVVNTLWSAGAEAISVNGQRLVSTTAIRNAGGAVLVNFRVLTSPFRISAIGDPDVMESILDASDISKRFRAWEQIYGLGFSVSTERDLQIPAYSGSLAFRYARPVQQGG
jgi:uncharacterized protein YlxW (UPF0749 family)